MEKKVAEVTIEQQYDQIAQNRRYNYEIRTWGQWQLWMLYAEVMCYQ